MALQTVCGKDRIFRLVTSALVAQIPLRGTFRPRRRNFQRRKVCALRHHIFFGRSL